MKDEQNFDRFQSGKEKEKRRRWKVKYQIELFRRNGKRKNGKETTSIDKEKELRHQLI